MTTDIRGLSVPNKTNPEIDGVIELQSIESRLKPVALGSLKVVTFVLRWRRNVVAHANGDRAIVSRTVPAGGPTTAVLCA